MKKGFVMAGLLLVIVVLGVMAFSGNNDEKSVTGNVVKNGKGSANSEAKIKNIEVKGSDTMLQVVSNLAEEYSKKNGDVRISVTGGGSGTGIASLINGEILIADSSREIKTEELESAREAGVEVFEVMLARDMLSVIVNEKNGVSELTKEEVAGIFKGEITNWEEVGGKDSEITLYGRQSTSGTYIFFQEFIEGDYAKEMRNLEGSQAILDEVRNDESGVGYVGIGYIENEKGELVEGINAVNIAFEEGEEYVSSLDDAKIDDYPISRPLMQYLASKPEINSEIYKFIEFELSEEGQDIVDKSGFVRLDEARRQKILESLR